MAVFFRHSNPYRRMRTFGAIGAVLIAVAWLGRFTFFASGDDARPGGDVEMLLRGPDGRPLTNARVMVTPAGRITEGGQTSEITTQSDGEGKVHFRWTPGVVRNMDVRVEGIGYGFTGTCEILLNRTTKVPLAPLTPYGLIAGALPEGLATPRTVITLQPLDNTYERQVSIPFVADGRFKSPVRAGRWRIIASEDQRALAELESICIAPGQELKGLALHPPLPHPPAPAEAPPAQTGPWAKGAIRDEAGRPINGAAVYAVAVYNSGARVYETVIKATSDAAGHYEITGDPTVSSFTASVIAAIPGRPPAISWIASPSQMGKTPPGDLDLIIPAVGTSLEIAVRRQGQPVAGAAVAAWLEGVELRDHWAPSSGSLERAEVEAIIHPVKVADRNGVARFDGLLPGTYRIVAAAGDPDRLRDLQNSTIWESRDEYAVADGIPARIGAVSRHQINIFNQAFGVQMKSLRADGRPMASGVFEYSGASAGEWSRTVSPMGGDLLQGIFNAPGLRRVHFKYRDSGIGTARVGEEPYYQVAGFVGASHLLEMKAKVPARFTANRYDPGTIVAELRNAAGGPTRGVVEVDEESGRCFFTASCDSSGVVRFEGVPAGKYIVRAYPAGETPIDIGSGETALPAADRLSRKTAVIPQQIEVSANSEQHALLRADAVGFMLGVIKPAAGHPAIEYFPAITTDTQYVAPVHFRASSGEFLAGPLPTGMAKVSVYPRSTSEHPIDPIPAARQEVSIDSARPARVELTATAPGAAMPGVDENAKNPASRLPMYGLPFKLGGRVLQHDGKTPALAAHVMLLGPPNGEVILSGLADAKGVIHARPIARNAIAGAGDLKQPVAIAWLPGATGPVIKPVDRIGADGLELILPAPKSLRGKITIAGLPPPGRDERIRVMAGPADQGSLAPLLSVQTIAQPDGSFELFGLAPGKYEVQAAFDDLWLSESVPVTISDGALEPITLPIATLGGPLIVKIVGNGGKPMRDRPVTIDRPKGPLNTLLWPKEWHTDGAGEIWIAALEAGEHTVRVPRTPRTGLATVLRLPVDTPVALQIQIDEKANP